MATSSSTMSANALIKFKMRTITCVVRLFFIFFLKFHFHFSFSLRVNARFISPPPMPTGVGSSISLNFFFLLGAVALKEIYGEGFRYLHLPLSTITCTKYPNIFWEDLVQGHKVHMGLVSGPINHSFHISPHCTTREGICDILHGIKCIKKPSPHRIKCGEMCIELHENNCIKFDLVQGHKVHMAPSGAIRIVFFSALHHTRRNMQKDARNNVRKRQSYEIKCDRFLFSPPLANAEKWRNFGPFMGPTGMVRRRIVCQTQIYQKIGHLNVIKVSNLDDFQRTRKTTTKKVYYISFQKMALVSAKKGRSHLLSRPIKCVRACHVTSASPTALPKKIKKAKMAAFWNQIAKIFAILLAAKPRYKKVLPCSI